MSGMETNVLMIGMILLAFGVLYLATKHIARWKIWVMPIVALLGFGLLYSILYILDARNGIDDVLLYNGLNNFLRAQSYATVIMYAVAFLVMRRKGK